MDTLDEIVDAVERTTEGIAEVAVATDEQAVSAEEVTPMIAILNGPALRGNSPSATAVASTQPDPYH